MFHNKKTTQKLTKQLQKITSSTINGEYFFGKKKKHQENKTFKVNITDGKKENKLHVNLSENKLAKTHF